MNTTEILALAKLSHKRPDKNEEALSALNEGLSICTMRARFARDLVEQQLDIDANEYSQTIDFSTEFTRFRIFKYLRPTSQRKFLEKSDSLSLFSPGGQIQRDKYFIGGTNLTFILSVLDTSLQVGFYQYAPILTESDGSNEYWMLDLMPFAIINYVKAEIFRSIGDDASAKLYMGKYDDQFEIGRRDFVDSAIVSAR